MASFPGQAGQACTRQVKPIWILTKQEMMGWQWYQLNNMQIISASSREITTPPPHQFFAGWMLF